MRLREHPAAQAKAAEIHESKGFDPFDDDLYLWARKESLRLQSRSRLWGIPAALFGMFAILLIVLSLVDWHPPQTVTVLVFGVLLLVAVVLWPGRKSLASYRRYLRECLPILDARDQLLWAAAPTLAKKVRASLRVNTPGGGILADYDLDSDRDHPRHHAG